MWEYYIKRSSFNLEIKYAITNQIRVLLFHYQLHSIMKIFLIRKVVCLFVYFN